MEEKTLSQRRNSGEGIYSAISQHDLPNARTVLVLGILSIAFSWLHLLSFMGTIMAIVTLVISARDIKIYRKFPEKFTLSSRNNIRAGRVCALIGLCISIMVFSIVLFITLELIPMMPFWGMTNQ